MSDGLLLSVLSLTVFRLTWLVTRDSFPPIRRIRELIKAKARQEPRWVPVDDDGDEMIGVHFKVDEEVTVEQRGAWASLAVLVMCPWCMGLWITGGVVSATWCFRDLPLPFLWYGAVAALAAVMCWFVDLSRE